MNDELKLPPHSIESEQSVIGGIMLEPYRIDDLPCAADDFYRHDHKLIFTAMIAMAERNQSIDIVTLAERLEAKGELEQVGGLAYLGALAQNTPGAGNIKRYAEIVREKALLRELVIAGSEIADRAFSSQDSAEEQVANAESTIFAVMEKREVKEPVGIDKAVLEAVDHFGSVLDGLVYLETGLIDLDRITGGLRGGAVYVVAARPSMGKTALACSIARHIASEGKPVYFATLEMPRREIASRLMAIDGNVNIGAMKEWGDEDYAKITKAAATIKDLPITIDEEEGLTIAKLRSRARRTKRRKGLACIVVDYLQLMKHKDPSRERQIAELSGGIKSLAKELDVPVILLAQLNRECDSRNDKRPLLSDLRESGSIEQDADVVIMLYRDEVYNKDTQYKGMAELIIRKNRHGSIGDVYTQFNHETMHFRNRAHDWMAPEKVQENNRKRGFD